MVEDNQKVGLEAAILERVRNESLVKLAGPEKDGTKTGHRYTDPPKGDEVARRHARTEVRS